MTPTGEGRRVAERAERMLGDTRQLLQTLPPDDLAAVERVLDHLQARPSRGSAPPDRPAALLDLPARRPTIEERASSRRTAPSTRSSTASSSSTGSP